MNQDELMKLDKSEIITMLLSAFSTIEQQSQKISDLEARLHQNSTNSSRPPSSDVFPRPQIPRKPSGKRAGGQKGHKGKGFKLTHPPDVIVEYDPVQCTGCAHVDACTSPKTVSNHRYEVDIEIKTVLTEHQTLRVQCPRTNEMITGNFPLDITSTVQYGVNLEALAICLNTSGMVSINRTHEILSDVFGVPISVGTIATMVKNCARTLSKTISQIKDEILGETLVHFDETGVRVNGKTFWMHAAVTKKHSYHFVSEKRGQEGMNEAGILPNYDGTGVHDCWSPYFKYDGIDHALCGAHVIRELIAVLENTDQTWPQKMIDLLLEINATKNELIAQGQHEAPEQVWREYSRRYDEILQEAQTQNPLPEKDPNKKGPPKRGKIRALIDRLVLHKEKWLLFFTDFRVPFTNNQAERDIRPFKVKLKVSGCFRTKDGAKDFATIMSFTSTARKRGISAFRAIKDALVSDPFSERLALASK
jgi:transposase